MNPKRLMKFFVSSQFPKIATAFGFTSTNKLASDYFMNLFIETVKYREENGVRRNDFMQMLIDLRNSNEGKGLELSELASESFIFFGGGEF
jgi:cytochrome P450 family 6